MKCGECPECGADDVSEVGVRVSSFCVLVSLLCDVCSEQWECEA